MYEYIQDKKTRLMLRERCENYILNVQHQLKDYFTFSFKLIGSGDSRLMMTNGKNKSIDLDYNIVIQRDKKQLIGKPNKIKQLFMSAFKEICGSGVKVSDSTKAITCYIGKINGYTFSFDIAVFIDGNDGFTYKLINDKNSVPSRYIWNKVPQSNNFEYKFMCLKREGYWEEIKDLYKNKKNKCLVNKDEKTSFEILLSVINELIQKHKISL